MRTLRPSDWNERRAALAQKADLSLDIINIATLACELATSETTYEQRLITILVQETNRTLRRKLVFAKMIALFTRMCGDARSGVPPDPNLLFAFWRDKIQKFLSFLRALEPTRTFGSYRFFKGIELAFSGSSQ